MEKKTFQNVVRKNILFLFCFLIIFSSTLISCFATSKTLPKPDVVSPYIVVYQPWSDRYLLYYSSKGFMYNKNKSRVCYMENIQDDSCYSGSYQICSSPYTSWKINSYIWIYNFNLFNATENQYAIIIYSNADIYYVNDNYVKTDDIYFKRNTVPWADFDFENVSTDGDGSSDSGTSVVMTETNSILNSIKSSLNAFKDNFNSFSTSIKENITNGFNGVKTKFDTLITTLTTFDDKLMAKLDEIKYSIEYNCNPNHPDIVENEGSFSQSIQNNIKNKFIFINDFETSLSSLSGATTGINIEHNVIVGNIIFPIRINFDWYEPYRLKIRGFLSIFFDVLLALSLIRIVYGIFNIGLGRGVTGYMGDPTLNTSGKIVSQQEAEGSSKVESYVYGFDEYENPYLKSHTLTVSDSNSSHSFNTDTSSEKVTHKSYKGAD